MSLLQIILGLNMIVMLIILVVLYLAIIAYWIRRWFK